MSSTLLYLLILEDETSHVEAIRRAFQTTNAPVEIQTASTLQMYCEMVDSRTPDIAIMDLNLPDGNPMESLSLLTENPAFPVLVMTSCGNESVAVAAMKLGALDYLVKSEETFNDMPRTVRAALREWNLMQAHKASEEAVRLSLIEKESLLKEIHHRVKNNLQIVSSLLRLQSARLDNPVAKAALQDMQNRVRSMALIHEHLYRSDNLAEVQLSEYVHSLCTQLMHALVPHSSNIQLHLDLASVRLSIDQAIPCGLIVNELVSNALTHAFPDGRAGEVRVELNATQDTAGWRLRVADNGVGMPEDFELSTLSHLTSLGLQLVFDLTRQLGGQLAIKVDTGTVFDIVFKEVHA